MEIRKLTAEDAKEYYRLRIEALRDSPDAFATRLEDALKRPVEDTAKNLSSAGAVTFGAFSGSELVGNVTLRREAIPKMNHRGAVLAVYVTPKVRGKGIASRLMDELISYAENWSGLEQLYLMVVSENETAKDLYIRHGFEIYGTELRSMKTEEKYIDENLMVKFLQGAN